MSSFVPALSKRWMLCFQNLQFKWWLCWLFCLPWTFWMKLGHKNQFHEHQETKPQTTRITSTSEATAWNGSPITFIVIINTIDAAAFVAFGGLTVQITDNANRWTGLSFTFTSFQSREECNQKINPGWSFSLFIARGNLSIDFRLKCSFYHPSPFMHYLWALEFKCEETHFLLKEVPWNNIKISTSRVNGYSNQVSLNFPSPQWEPWKSKCLIEMATPEAPEPAWRGHVFLSAIYCQSTSPPLVHNLIWVPNSQDLGNLASFSIVQARVDCEATVLPLAFFDIWQSLDVILMINGYPMNSLGLIKNQGNGKVDFTSLSPFLQFFFQIKNVHGQWAEKRISFSQGLHHCGSKPFVRLLRAIFGSDGPRTKEGEEGDSWMEEQDSLSICRFNKSASERASERSIVPASFKPGPT